MKRISFFFFAAIITAHLFPVNMQAQSPYHEQHRPQIHFSPKEKWMNDPNGMVYFNGVYHLFFQYYPDSTVWGPMHWGHATSKDLIHWKQLPIALYPDKLGYIFSGSAVVDKNNTSGFGKNGKIPLIAIFTSHDPNKKAEKSIERENESIAYSLDNGNTWTKYADNPVLKNPGITDFRDPKVMWYEPQKKWIMTLATKDRITFYSSHNFKEWKRESDFGKDAGAHGGVWECPDLFSLNDDGKIVWVLISNINPGGPNKGSATQYFLGNFDGNKFTPFSTGTKWLDYGPDNYAGITWSNTGDRKIFLGWMSNWLYANQVPTEKWRNAMTVPRELKLRTVGNEMFVVSVPVKELSSLEIEKETISNIPVGKALGGIKFPGRLNLEVDQIKDFSITLSNDLGEETVIGFNKANSGFYIDRTKSGKHAFNAGFAAIHTAPRFSNDTKMNVSLIIDVSSIELFADDGLTVMTEIFFPDKPYDKIKIDAPDKSVIKNLKYIGLKGIWQ